MRGRSDEASGNFSASGRSTDGRGKEVMRPRDVPRFFGAVESTPNTQQSALLDTHDAAGRVQMQQKLRDVRQAAQRMPREPLEVRQKPRQRRRVLEQPLTARVGRPKRGSERLLLLSAPVEDRFEARRQQRDDP